MSSVLPFLITGLVTGSLYALAGLGLVLTYRTSGVFNFGHGAIAAGGAFVFYTLHTNHAMPWPPAMLLTVAAFALVGGPLLEWLTRTLGAAPAAVGVIATVGLFLAVNGVLSEIYGSTIHQASQFLPEDGPSVSGVVISYGQMITAGIALVGAVGLFAFLQNSRLGVAMRAVVDNPSLVGLAGQYPTRIRRVAWMIGAGFAAMSGILLAPVLGLDATLLTLLVVQAFGGCAIGLFRSLPMTYLGGLVVGVAAALATRFFTSFPLNQIPPAVPFLILMAVLLVVPVRMLPGTRSLPQPLASAARALNPRLATLIAVVGLVLLAFVPSLVGTRLPVWTDAMSSVCVFGSLALLIWTSGQMSLCQVTFAALGATTMAHLRDGGVPWPLALLLAGLLTVPIGAMIAIPAIRFSGIYLALVTFGFGIFMQYVIYPTRLMFGNDLAASASRMQAGPIRAQSSERWQYYVALTVALLSVAGLIVINRSRFGRILRGLAESPTMLGTLGLDVNVTRLLLFCASAFFAGIGGGLMSSQYTVSATGFNPIQSLMLVAVLGICALFGTRLILTTVLAAVLFSVIPGYVDNFDANAQILAFGVLAVLAGLTIANRDRLSTWMRAQAAQKQPRLRYGPAPARGHWTPPWPTSGRPAAGGRS
jgi:branched-subunit amino acid ABC-type transport system permease component